MSEDVVEIFTDGACKGNPGVGVGVRCCNHGQGARVVRRRAHTTNNRMELMGAICALEALKRPCRVILHTTRNMYSRHQRVGTQLETTRLEDCRQEAGEK